MPISLWRKWVAWFRFQGPPGGLRDDYHAADLALRTSVAYTPDDKRHIVNFLDPWRKPSDFKHWVDFGEQPDPDRPVEYSIE